MPRIRQPQIKQPMGNPNLPDTGPVIVDLASAPPEKPTLVYGSSAYQVPDGGLRPSHTVALDQPPPVTTQPESIQSDAELDDPERSLRRTRDRAKSRREQSLEAQNQELQKWGAQQATAAAQATHQVTQSNLDTVTSALGQAEADLQTAKRGYAEAWGKGDGMGVADAQAAIADAQYRINTLRAGKDELEQQVRTPPRPQPPPATAVDANVEMILNQLTNLRPDEKDWIRQHPEAVSQHNQTRLRVAFDDSQRKGLTRGSKEYFQFLNDRLDFGEGGEVGDAEPEYEEEEAMEEPAPRRQAPPRQERRVAAPVSRAGMGQGSLPPGKIRLDEVQRNHAKLSGVSELEYARGVQRLIDAKKQGLYPSG